MTPVDIHNGIKEQWSECSFKSLAKCSSESCPLTPTNASTWANSKASWIGRHRSNSRHPRLRLRISSIKALRANVVHQPQNASSKWKTRMCLTARRNMDWSTSSANSSLPAVATHRYRRNRGANSAWNSRQASSSPTRSRSVQTARVPSRCNRRWQAPLTSGIANGSTSMVVKNSMKCGHSHFAFPDQQSTRIYIHGLSIRLELWNWRRLR